jgi:hypothetical protein
MKLYCGNRPIRVHTVMAKPIEMDASFDEKLVDESIKIVCDGRAIMRCLA